MERWRDLPVIISGPRENYTSMKAPAQGLCLLCCLQPGAPQGPCPLESLPHPTDTTITFGAPPPPASCEIEVPDPILATDLVRGLMDFLCGPSFPSGCCVWAGSSPVIPATSKSDLGELEGMGWPVATRSLRSSPRPLARATTAMLLGGAITRWQPCLPDLLCWPAVLTWG